LDLEEGVKSTGSILDKIISDVRTELAEAQRQRPLAELQRMLADASPVRPFAEALRNGFGLIAEIKECSPSHGSMRRQNIDEAPLAYQQNSLVRAISVLTNSTHFGMSMERLRQVKLATTKPVLRKDFIFDDYQVYEARAFGADAILLMANLLDAAEMRRLYQLARELGMNALFECHIQEEIAEIPENAEIYGINSRTFAARENMLGVGRYGISKLLGQLGAKRDLTIDQARFDLGQYLPAKAIKVAESGVTPQTVKRLRDELGYHAALVGTSLLTSTQGIAKELDLFSGALSKPCSWKSGHPSQQ
jgi:indole-3-glycerol phosphate synthase